MLREIQTLQESVIGYLAKFEEASKAISWMTEWLRNLENRISSEDVTSEDNFRPALARRGYSLRAYTEELDTFERLSGTQQNIIQFWKVPFVFISVISKQKRHS